MPALFERALVERLAFQVLGMGIPSQMAGLRRIEYAAPLQLVNQQQRLVPVLGLLLRFEFEAQCRGVLVGQGPQGDQCFLEAPLVEQHVGRRDDAHDRFTGCHLSGAREIGVALVVTTQLVRRARGQHRAKCRRVSRLHRHHRGFFGAPEAAGEKRIHRGEQRGARIVAAAALAIFAHLARQPDGAEDEAQQQVADDERSAQ